MIASEDLYNCKPKIGGKTKQNNNKYYNNYNKQKSQSNQKQSNQIFSDDISTEFSYYNSDGKIQFS